MCAGQGQQHEPLLNDRAWPCFLTGMVLSLTCEPWSSCFPVPPQRGSKRNHNQTTGTSQKLWGTLTGTCTKGLGRQVQHLLSTLKLLPQKKTQWTGCNFLQLLQRGEELRQFWDLNCNPTHFKLSLQTWLSVENQLQKYASCQIALSSGTYKTVCQSYS